MSKRGPLRYGESREDGKVFISYDRTGWEWWVSREEFIAHRARKKACTKICESRPESKLKRNFRRNSRYSSDERYRKKVCEQVKASIIRNPAAYLLTLAKGRAKRLGVPFDLAESDVIIPKVCPVLKIPLCRSTGCGPAPGSPTLDRLNPKLGYVKGNVFVISSKANRIKNNATPEELRAVLNWVEEVVSRVK